MVACTLFDTPLGRCGIAWSERGVRSVQLPEADDVATRARLRRDAPDATDADETPAAIADIIAAINALLRGARTDLSWVALDMERVPGFDRRVYEVARGIAAGDTMTYGEVAARLGEPDAARAVGAALGRNPFTIVVPCHRVLAAAGRRGAFAVDGRIGGFSAPGGAALKRRLLSIERAEAVASLFDDGSTVQR